MLMRRAVGPACLALVCVIAGDAAGRQCQPRWDLAVGTPGAAGSSGAPSVAALLTWNGSLYIGGTIASVGGVPGTFGMARLTNGVVTPLGMGTDDGFVNDFLPYNDGAGEKLYIGGAFGSVNGGLANSRALVRWTGSSIETVPGNPFVDFTYSVFALAKFQNRLWAGGTGPGGAGQLPSMFSFDGSTWTGYGPQFAGPVAPVVLAMTTWNDGTGEKLYIGGRFASVDPDPINPSNPLVISANIVAFDGTNWFPLDTGLTRSTSIISQVLALTVFNDGSGSRLYAGGRFDRGSGNVCNAVARWNGTTWQPVGDGFPMPTEVRDFEVFDDGGGPRLYVAGNFTVSGVTTVRRFARWNGTAWEEVGGGLSDSGTELATSVNGGRRSLVIGGSFLGVANGGTGGGTVGGLAEWLGCRAACPGDTNASGTVNFADLNTVLGQFGQSGSGLSGDVNFDGVVNFADLNIVLGNFGLVC